MLKLQRRVKSSVHFGFVGERVYVAIATGKTHFEPSLMQDASSLAQIRDYLYLVESVVWIVDDLNLNRRIWTKE